ncbi:MAG TPA: hypothetical protein VF407_11645 [Polyangiaceae bacterium]
MDPSSYDNVGPMNHAFHSNPFPFAFVTLLVLAGTIFGIAGIAARRFGRPLGVAALLAALAAVGVGAQARSAVLGLTLAAAESDPGLNARARAEIEQSEQEKGDAYLEYAAIAVLPGLLGAVALARGKKQSPPVPLAGAPRIG